MNPENQKMYKKMKKKMQNFLNPRKKNKDAVWKSKKNYYKIPRS